MIPYAFGSSDGLFNLGSALSFAQVLPPGVYVAMNGTAFAWDRVRKNTQTGYFEHVKRRTRRARSQFRQGQSGPCVLEFFVCFVYSLLDLERQEQQLTLALDLKGDGGVVGEPPDDASQLGKVLDRSAVHRQDDVRDGEPVLGACVERPRRDEHTTEAANTSERPGERGGEIQPEDAQTLDQVAVRRHQVREAGGVALSLGDGNRQL